MRRFVSCLILTLLASSSATAATISVNWNPSVFDPSGVGIGTVSYPGGSVATSAGRFSGAVGATVGIDPASLVVSGAEFYAYCFDLAQFLVSDTYTVVPGAPTAVLDFLGAANAFFGGGPFRWLTPATGDQAAAVQLGLWEALYNDDFNLMTGGVSFSAVPSSVASLFNSINALRSTTADLDAQYVMRLTSPNTQDVITGVRALPEPHGVALLGLAAVVAGWMRRRTR